MSTCLERLEHNDGLRWNIDGVNARSVLKRERGEREERERESEREKNGMKVRERD